MVAGPIAGTVEILQALHTQGTPLYGLTNWSAEKFALTRQRFEFFECFRDITVSGEVHLVKPDPAIFHLSLQRFGLRPQECIFIDDSPVNCLAAHKLGITAIEFHHPEQLAEELRGFEILGNR